MKSGVGRHKCIGGCYYTQKRRYCGIYYLLICMQLKSSPYFSILLCTCSCRCIFPTGYNIITAVLAMIEKFDLNNMYDVPYPQEHDSSKYCLTTCEKHKCSMREFSTGRPVLVKHGSKTHHIRWRYWNDQQMMGNSMSYLFHHVNKGDFFAWQKANQLSTLLFASVFRLFLKETKTRQRSSEPQITTSGYVQIFTGKVWQIFLHPWCSKTNFIVKTSLRMRGDFIHINWDSREENFFIYRKIQWWA